MGKTDYSKAEQSVSESVRALNTKKILQGLPIVSPHAEEFFDIASSRPVQQEAIERLVGEMAATEEGLSEDPEHFLPITEQLPLEESESVAPLQSPRTPKKQPISMETLLPSQRYISATDALLILRNHILWLKRHHIEDRYERIGSTEQEVMEFRKTSRLSQSQLKRILELNKQAEVVKQEILQTQASDDDLIAEKMKQQPHTKNLSVRDDWISL